MKKDYYGELEIKKNASQDEIRKAFRQQARKYHPDINTDNPSAEKKFKKINEAYEVLANTKSRQAYDKYGDDWKHAERMDSQFRDHPTWSYQKQKKHPYGFGQQNFGGFGDLFRGFSNGDSVRKNPTPKKARLETTVNVSLDEAYNGSLRIVTISPKKENRRIEVTIPAGVDTGSIVKIKPKDSEEILLKITVTPDDRFSRNGLDLYYEAKIPFVNLILGDEIPVVTLNNTISVTIPQESQNGQKIRIKGKGMPKLGSPEEKGDLFVVLIPTFPRDLTEQQKKLLQKFRDSQI